MAITTIITGAQKRSKDSCASSPVVGLLLRVNGEESPKVIDARGNVYAAGIAAPTVAPTPTVVAGGAFPDGYVAYVYVYASSRFPFVESDLAVDGKLFPRSNPSPLTVAHFTGGNNQVNGTVTKTTAPGIDVIWIFRTALFASSLEAQTAAEAGEAFFVTEVVNDGVAGTVAFTDNDPIDSTDQVQSDNYVAPQFQFTVFYDPYWWGFGNLPFAADAEWDNSGVGATGLITLTGTDTWFDGRDGQNVTLEGITTGGYDGLGTFKFKWISSTTAGVTTDGSTLVALPAVGTGRVTIQGPATTLYRSKARNPFSWGFTQVIGDANVPQQYGFKVGGGLGTALAVVPNNATLKLDTEYPAKCFTLNLRAAGTTAFENTLRIISDVYSVSAHFSQFAAVTKDGNTVLWGLDFKNFAIVQSDGITQVPISSPIPRIMRALTQDRSKQLFSHGVYDPRTELNCMWVASANSLTLINYLIYQHAPTGFWGFMQENDLLCSASLQDTLTGGNKTFVGTQSGFLGQALVEGVYNNWLPDTGTYTGVISDATDTSITISEGAFNITDDGIVGNWALVTDENGQQEQLARISSVTDDILEFDLFRSFTGGGITEFNPVPQAGWRYYIGLIECRLLKYFDFNLPQTDKALMELWLTQQNVDTEATGTLIRWYRERENSYQQFAALQNKYGENADEPSDAWFVDDEVPAELVKMFGLEIINRGYMQWRFVNMVLKPRTTP